ncbi:MAG: glyoxalase [Spirochaetia bacterium]|nr:glyoxalase [Spirochaetia bacterium]
MNIQEAVLGLRAFVPSKDFEKSKAFYRDFGFLEEWSSGDLCLFKAGVFSFFLQKFYSKEMADNFMLDLRVSDVDAVWETVKHLGDKHEGVKVRAPRDESWGLREIHIIDPAGVCWHISASIKK